MAASKTPAEPPEDAELVETPDSVTEEAQPDARAAGEAGTLTGPADTGAARPAPRRSGAFAGFVLGGIFAAAGGFGLAQFLPQVWPVQPDTSTIEAKLAEQSERLSALGAEVAELPSPAPLDEAALISRLETTIDTKLAALPQPADPAAAISALQSSLEAKLTDFESRLTSLEKRPAGSGSAPSSAALAAYERELQTLREQIGAVGAGSSTATADIQAMAAEVKAQLLAATSKIRQLDAMAAADAALGRIQSALEVGGPFAAALKTISDAGITIPEPLTAAAEAGTTPLVELQRSFPEAARAALEAARRSDMGDGWVDRMTSFFKVQTGVRSLEPREGADPDALLSRAEAALAAGRLDQALSELAQLPEAAKVQMAAWLAEAEARLAATSAFETLAAAMEKS